jgi:alkylhydroperoxidase family enzyme
MLNSFINWRLTVAERRMGFPVEYLRHILRVSRRAFFAFTKIMPLANYRRVLPLDALHVARLTTLSYEDCGTCLQGEVNLAKRDGVDLSIIQAILNAEAVELSEELADVYHFALAVLETRDDDTLRERIKRHYGEEGLVELALAIGACRVFPTVKRALGYAQSCSVEPIRV